MKKPVALSIVSAMALALGACAKSDESANAVDNVANEAVAVDGGNLTADTVTADNAVVGDNTVAELNATDATATNAAEANVTNSN